VREHEQQRFGGGFLNPNYVSDTQHGRGSVRRGCRYTRVRYGTERAAVGVDAGPVSVDVYNVNDAHKQHQHDADACQRCVRSLPTGMGVLPQIAFSQLFYYFGA
jgi:hypothetical protein